VGRPGPLRAPATVCPLNVPPGSRRAWAGVLKDSLFLGSTRMGKDGDGGPLVPLMGRAEQWGLWALLVHPVGRTPPRLGAPPSDDVRGGGRRRRSVLQRPS